ncbi:2'-5' RNA ligase family protein [Streptococcus sp. ZY19097]|uniref:2'-5' RNA ligase family protein n=1 Tax=Streptococcus sp. ZY19097 TaxID=3231906 RepID=UPI00345A0ED7
MYAIIATLDETTNQKIRNLWQELKDMSLSDYAYQVRDREPHITLADFETIAVEEVLESLGDKLNLTLPLELSFQAIGSFWGSSIVFLGPTKTP